MLAHGSPAPPGSKPSGADRIAAARTGSRLASPRHHLARALALMAASTSSMLATYLLVPGCAPDLASAPRGRRVRAEFVVVHQPSDGQRVFLAQIDLGGLPTTLKGVRLDRGCGRLTDVTRVEGDLDHRMPPWLKCPCCHAPAVLSAQRSSKSGAGWSSGRAPGSGRCRCRGGEEPATSLARGGARSGRRGHPHASAAFMPRPARRPTGAARSRRRAAPPRAAWPRVGPAVLRLDVPQDHCVVALDASLSPPPRSEVGEHRLGDPPACTCARTPRSSIHRCQRSTDTVPSPLLVT